MSPRIEKAIHRPSGLHAGSSGPADTAGNMCRSSRSEWPYRFGRALVTAAPSTIPPAATPRASRCHAWKRIMSASEPWKTTHGGWVGDDREDGDAPYPVEQREGAIHVRIASGLERSLTALAHTTSRRLAVSRVQAVEHRHPLDDRAEHRERLAVAARVVGEVDVDLRVPRVRLALHCKGKGAARVAGAGRIIGKVPILPGGVHGWITMEPELHNVAGVHAVESC